jgi:tetratricopeptide (TPR) repeat protein
MRPWQAPCVAVMLTGFLILEPRHAGAQTTLADSVQSILQQAESLASDSPDSALTLYAMAAELSGRVADGSWRIQALRGTGVILFERGRLDSALHYFTAILLESRRIGDRTAEQDAHGSVGAVFTYLGQPDSAFPHLRAALAIAREINLGPENLGLALSNLGGMFFNRGQLDSALAYFQEARQVIAPLNDPASLALLANNIGAAFRERGRPDSALVYYGEALKHNRQSGDRRRESATLNNAGMAYRDLGRYDSALVLLSRAAVLARELKNSLAEGRAVNNIGYVYHDLGRPDSALSYLRRARAIKREAQDRQGEATTINNIGAVYLRDSKPDSALPLFRDALVLARAVDDSVGIARTLDNLGSGMADLGRLDSAWAYQVEALMIRRATNDRAGEGSSLQNLGSIHEVRGQIDSALDYSHRALAIAREVASLSDEVWSLQRLGELFARPSPVRSLARSVAYYDTAAAVSTRIRRQAGTDVNRLTFAESRLSLTEGWTLALLAQSEAGGTQGTEASLAAAERGRARGLADMMPNVDPSEDSAGQGTLPEQAARFLAPLRRDRTAGLFYLTTPDTLIIWMLLPSGELRVSRIPVPLTTLTGLVTTLRTHLGADSARQQMARSADGRPREQEPSGEPNPRLNVRGRLRTVTRELSRLLLPSEFLDGVPEGSELVVVPHGLLGLVPFTTLYAGSSNIPLSARYALRYTPSLSLLSAIGESPPSRAGTSPEALVVGNPAMPLVSDDLGHSTRLTRLPGAQAEAEAVARLLAATALVGDDATEGAVRARLNTAPLVHLATHGLAFGSEVRSRFSYIALGSDSTYDGILTVGEIMDDPSLRLQAELVVLSACQTGVGNVKQAEGTIGLQRAFLAKGARSVLVSLWNVDDRVTGMMMERFYTHWLKDSDQPSKAEALRRSQEDVRRTRGLGDPRYWAAFQLVGAP